jgi:hypothetical protein
MSEESKKKEIEIKIGKGSRHDAAEIAEVLSVVSEKIPALVKGLVGSVFSPEAGASMGKAAAAYYKELKAGGLPDDVAIRMTQDYVSTFTKIGDLFRDRKISLGEPDKGATAVGIAADEEIRKAVLEKIKKKLESED